jgi:hypothetical protein
MDGRKTTEALNLLSRWNTEFCSIHTVLQVLGARTYFEGSVKEGFDSKRKTAKLLIFLDPPTSGYSGTQPLIQPSRNVTMAGTHRTEPSCELRGDLAVHGFWTRGQTAIFDVRITDTDQPSNRNTAPTKVLLRHEKEKKDKYGTLCIERRRTFTPLVFFC